MQRVPLTHMFLTAALASSLGLAASAALAAEKSIDIMAISAGGVGAKIGTIQAKDTRQGLLLTPALAGLAPPGPHGFHLHERPDCGPGPGANNQPAAGMAAGGHYDPEKTGKHHGPYGMNSRMMDGHMMGGHRMGDHRRGMAGRTGAMGGHRGDLPPLVVNADGTATLPVLAPQLKVADLSGKALMIHAGGDNYSDDPAPLGGGGPRIACGVIK
jgi:Cu-Zn family superoxide dismutase